MVDIPLHVHYIVMQMTISVMVFLEWHDCVGHSTLLSTVYGIVTNFYSLFLSYHLCEPHQGLLVLMEYFVGIQIVASSDRLTEIQLLRNG